MTLEGLLHLVGGIVVGAPLVYAGASKILEPAGFAQALPKFGLWWRVPDAPTARAIGLGEVTLGAAVVLLPSAASAAVITCVYAVFAGLVARALSRGHQGDCGCFGAIRSDLGVPAVVRNAGFAAASAGLAALRADGLAPAYDLGTAGLVTAILVVGSTALDTYLVVRRS